MTIGKAGRKTATSPASQRKTLRAMFERMCLVRQAELRLAKLFADNEIPGFIHLSLGQEAVAVGVCGSLRPTDTVASNHRGHGHALAKGLPVDQFFLELFGRQQGICGGRGGSMHIADMSVGMLGANGIVGGGLTICAGSALAHQFGGNGDVAVVFFGDGALGEGAFHEAVNLASIWKLPLLFVCENNGWAEFSQSADQIAFTLSRLAEAYGVYYRNVDGLDVEAVSSETITALTALREGDGPAILECRTVRWRGHFEGDPQRYRDDDEQKSALSADCVEGMRVRLVDLGESEEELSDVVDRISQQIEQAVEDSRSGIAPVFDEALREVFASLGERA